MTTALKVHGTDLSHHNSEPDFKKARAAGLLFAWLKCTEGTSFIDDTYKRRRDAARAAGVVPGPYHFARPEGGDAKAEARAFLAAADPKTGDLRCALDLEVDGGLTKTELRAWALAFDSVVVRHTGRHIVLYCPWDLNLPKFIKWVPRYNNSNTPPTIHTDVWQFSNGVYGVPNSFPGLGHVDLNTFRGKTRLDDIILKPHHVAVAKVQLLPVGSFNMGNEPAMTAADLDKLLRVVQIACLQETRDRQKRIAAWLKKNPEIAQVPFTGAGADDVSILYDEKRFTLKDFYTVPVDADPHVGDGVAHSGAGPDNLNPKCVGVAVFFDHLTNRNVTCINFHQIASWTRTAKYLGRDEYEARRAYGTALLKVVVDEVAKVTKGLIFTFCDANAKKDFELMAPFAAVVDLGNTDPTHGGREPIDFVGTVARGYLEDVTRQVPTGGYSSDHRPVIATGHVQRHTKAA